MLTRRLIKSQSVRSPLARYFADYDVCIIGGGPGGYVAAIKAAQLGLNTVCIEKRGALGGTCLNVGCIPSKALLNISHKYEEMNHAKDYGLAVDGLKYDWDKILEKKTGIVGGLTKGIEGLFKKNKVTYKVGNGELAGNNQVNVKSTDGKTETINAKVVKIKIRISSSLLEVKRLPFLEFSSMRKFSSALLVLYLFPLYQRL
jgi:dihydrolipoamide dehydrogenase